jgi:hypothetical protein
MIDDILRGALRDADTTMPTTLLDDLGRTLERDFDDLVEPTATPRSTPRVHGRVYVAIAVATAVAAAGVGVFAVTRSKSAKQDIGVQPDPTTIATTNAPDGLIAANALARRLLDHVILPQAATPTTARPPAILRNDDSFPPSKARITRHRRWTVPMTASGVSHFLTTHAAWGTVQQGYGTLTNPTGKAYTVNQHVTHPADDTIVSADIHYSIATTTPSASFVQVDVVIEWGPHHPHIPARDKVVVVSSTIYYPVHSKTVVVTDPRAVADLVAAFEKAPMRLPNSLYNCPSESVHPERYTLRFGPSRSAPPDVVVDFADTGCGTATVRIDGRAAPSIYGGYMVPGARTAIHTLPAAP